LQQAKEEAILMLELVQDMFETVTSALSGESSPEKRENITLTDKKVNRIHRRSRRKIFEHLSFAGNRDPILFLTGWIYRIMAKTLPIFGSVRGNFLP